MLTVAPSGTVAMTAVALPVLAIGGAESSGAMVADTTKLVADDGQGVVLANCGHWVAEQAPKQLLAALTAFLAPYRAGGLA
jgi:pimeloyl-ACP methyl ester carboxylesterase